ncbi:MAG: molybdate ABC transporter substrate-binding protein [Coriobacteriales bacterium]|nr:molybdate ABC transporter substrate-binding protein [Coriobacteriales bacterium]
MKRFAIAGLVVACVASLLLCLAGCENGTQQQGGGQENATVVAGDNGTADATPAAKTLEGHTLHIYCGAGMTNPFQEIADAFQQETGCTMEVTYANAAQIQTQINTTQEGDFFISGSVEELKPVEGYVATSTELVKHIPVLIVPKGNPKNISKIPDLYNCDLVLVGDPESTPIGKIAKNIMTKANIWDPMMQEGKISTTTTAPQIATALAKGEGDAGIVWKENVNSDNVEIVECDALKNAIKVIPAAQLTCCSDHEAAAAFAAFLQTDTAWDIWAKYGYERA